MPTEQTATEGLTAARCSITRRRQLTHANKEIQKTMILAVGNSQSDFYFSAVFDILKQRGKKTALFKADCCLEGEHIGLRVSSGSVGHYAVIDGREFDLREVEAVWMLKPSLPKSLRGIEPAEIRPFVYRQFLATWQSLYDLLPDRNWVSPPWNVVRADNKFYQLATASKLGFEVPETLISSDPGAVRQFWEHCEHQVVVKLLATSMIENHVIYTNKLKKEDLEKIERIRTSPSIFQRHIPKQFELRITVVGKEVFAARIDSQQDPETTIDWRRKGSGEDGVKLRATSLPEDVRAKCLSLVGHLGLRFGCIDMIVTPDNRYVFLEINPNGQWWFSQVNTGLPISSAIADLLCEG